MISAFLVLGVAIFGITLLHLFQNSNIYEAIRRLRDEGEDLYELRKKLEEKDLERQRAVLDEADRAQIQFAYRQGIMDRLSGIGRDTQTPFDTDFVKDEWFAGYDLMNDWIGHYEIEDSTPTSRVALFGQINGELDLYRRSIRAEDTSDTLREILGYVQRTIDLSEDNPANRATIQWMLRQIIVGSLHRIEVLDEEIKPDPTLASLHQFAAELETTRVTAADTAPQPTVAELLGETPPIPPPGPAEAISCGTSNCPVCCPAPPVAAG